ncbi:MAG: T9SS type A sorting domain-containing protein [Flavobacteriales bacterium]
MRRSLLCSLFVLPVLVFAQTGTNATCATAIELVVSPTNVPNELVLMEGRWYTNAVPEPATSCSGSTACIMAWFKFTATATTHWVRGEGQGTGDERMEVFSGSCGSLTSIACYPPESPIPALTGLTVGATYYLRVQMGNLLYCQSNYDTSCEVWVGVVSAPVHDECTGAIELPVVTGSTNVWPGTRVYSLGATQSAPACTGTATASDDDVWYRFTATAPTHFLPTNSMAGLADYVFQWYSGTCGNLTSLACDADLVSGLSPGSQYYVRAHSQSTDVGVTIQALADVLAPAPNDECAGALPLEVVSADEAPKPVSFTTINTTSSTAPCGTQQHDAWLSFIAPAASIVIGTEKLAHGALFSGSCGSLTCVTTNSNLSNPTGFSGLTPGTTYYLKIGNATTVRQNNRVWAFAATPNDACATASALQVQNEPVDHTYGHLYNGNTRAWYEFTATAPRLFVEGFTTCGPWATTLRARVHSGACGSLTQLAASNDVATPLVLNDLVVGQTYSLEVYATQKVGFRIAVRKPMANDVCEGALVLPFSEAEDFPDLANVSNTYAADGTGGCLPDKDLWYRFTATHSSAAFIAVGANIATSSLVDAAIELYTGTCGALTSVGCVQDVGRHRFTGLVPGTNYYLRWSSRVATQFTPMLFDQPVNDEVAGALPAPFGSTFAQSAEQYGTFAATQSMPAIAPCGGWDPDDDTWFTFTATATSHSVVARQSNYHFEEGTFTYNNFRVQVYDTLSSDAEVLEANTVGCGFSPLALTGLVVGRQYLYRAYQANGGPLSTCGYITCVTDADNDDAAGAMQLNYSSTYSAAFNTSGATQSMPGADCQVDDFADDDIWFKFTASAAPARIAIGYATADVTIELFSGAPGSLTSIACDGNILVLPTLVAGQIYYFRVYSWRNATPVAGRIGLITTPSLTANGCVDEACLGPVLVPNPGIEQGEHCAVHLAEVNATDGYGSTLAPGWPRMQSGSSDAWSSCAPFDSPVENPGGFNPGFTSTRVLSRSGKGMGGLYMAWGGPMEYVEYLQAPLAEPLVPGEPYLISFHAATNPRLLCLSGLGAALSEGPLVSGTSGPILVEPAVVTLEPICTRNWTNVCGVYVPTSPVDHITIGAFQLAGEAVRINDPDGYSYYGVDDVVVARINDPGCITSIGDVPPLDESTESNGDALRLFPNPANDRVSIVADASLFGQRAVIELFDATGKQVLADQLNSFGALQALELPAELKEGLYLVMVRVEGQGPKGARLVVKR